MIIRLPIRYEGANGEKILYTLFDSGASFSCINPDHVETISAPVRMRTPLRAATASGNAYLEIHERITPDFYIDDIRMSDEFMVVPDLTEEAIIGAATTQKWRIKLDFEHDAVIIDPRVAKIILLDLKFLPKTGS